MTPDTLKRLIKAASDGDNKLPREIETLSGYSAPKVRRLLNALNSQPGANYLEIGVAFGSTFIPAVYGNTAQATCIDNWSRFNSRAGFTERCKQYIPGRKFNMIDADCFTVDLKHIPQDINVYFYDGDHSAASQYKALSYFAPVLANEFVIVVDDCNWEEPREETKKALKDLEYTVLFDELLPGQYNGDQLGWWNGLYVALVKKS